MVHASSFTKTVCPGVRVGYLIGPEETIAAIAGRRPTPTSRRAWWRRRSSTSSALRRVRALHPDRAGGAGAPGRLLSEALRTHLPEARFTEPDGGYFLWVELPDDVSAEAVAAAAAARGVAVVKGTDFVLSGGEHALRLAYSAVRDDQIDEGVRRLAEAVTEVRRGV